MKSLETLLCLGALALTASASPAIARDAGPSATFIFGPASQVEYHVTHPLHRVVGITHALGGQVKVMNGRLVTPATFTVALTTFRSGNLNRDENALGVLEVGRFPTATFVVDSFAETARGDATGEPRIEGTANGHLTVHGVSKAIAIPLKAALRAQGVTVDAAFTVHFSDFNLTRPALMFVPVADDIPVTLHGVATANGN